MSSSTGRLREIWQDLKPQLSAFGSPNFLSDLKELFTIRKNPNGRTKLFIFLIGAIATAVTMGGCLIGYAISYNRFMRPNGELPRLNKLPTIVKAGMALGGILIWIVLILTFLLLSAILGPALFENRMLMVFLAINIVLSFSSYFIFRRWRNGIHNLISSSDQYGSTGWGYPHEMPEMFLSDGLYIGGNMMLTQKGHVITFGATRSGKGTGLILPNTLAMRNISGSLVLIDIKGEAAAISANALRAKGKKVVVINPWNMLPAQLTDTVSYNPLDILRDKKSINLIDDVAMVAELLVPIKANDRNAFFTDSARNVITGLLLHLVTSVDKPSLTMLWEWTRLYGEKWDNLLGDMAESKDVLNGRAVRNAANEILKIMESPETYSSIMSNVLEATSFLRSSPLQKSLESGFDPYSLAADGDTVLFVVLPPDKLSIMSRYLRLVTTTLLRAVVRQPGKKVTFIVDEAASLGYISEIPVAMAAYGGFNVSLWLIYQDIHQLQEAYGGKWESIMANSVVKQFVGVNDNATGEYVSKMLGKKTRTMYQHDIFGFVKDVETSQRDLATPDEVMRMTSQNMIIQISGKRPVTVPKVPYYYMTELKDETGQNLYDPNPYELNSL